MVSEKSPAFIDVFHFLITLPVKIHVKNRCKLWDGDRHKKLAHIHCCRVLFFVCIKQGCQDDESLGNC